MSDTTIAISRSTRDLLRQFGRKSERYDDIIRRLLLDQQLHEQLQQFIDHTEYSSLQEAREWTVMMLADKSRS